MKSPRIGVLALQGGYAAHEKVLRTLGAVTQQIRNPDDLRGCDALVFPGGESTTIHKLASERGLIPRMKQAVSAGLPFLGTCAGAILAAQEVRGHSHLGFDFLPLQIDRNAYGTQIDSFLTDSEQAAHRRVFIRAPKFVSWDETVEVLDALEDTGEPVALGWKNVTVATYHPELSGDPWLHQRLLAQIS